MCGDKMIKLANEVKVAIHDLTWPEVDRMKGTVRAVIIPVGSTEQHGPNLCISTDATRAYKFSLRVARALYPKVLVAPCIHVGISGHHMDFPGTITLRPETLINILKDYVSSLKRHGFRRFFIINAHGGNEGTLQVATENIRQEFGIRIPYVNYKTLCQDVTEEIVGTKRVDHSGEWEVSDAMFLAPEIVREDAICKGDEGNFPLKYTDIYGKYRINYPLNWKEVAPSGAMGEAHKATPEKGKRLNDAALKRAVEFLEQFMEDDY
jgi:creatinine amidohydrolase